MRVKSDAISREKDSQWKKSFTNALLSKVVLLYLTGSNSIRVILKGCRSQIVEIDTISFPKQTLAEYEIPHFQCNKTNSAAPVNKYVKSKLIIDSKICIRLRK